MNDLMKVVEHEKFGCIRSVAIEGKVWCVARDIAMTLGYERPSDAIRKHCKNVVNFEGIVGRHYAGANENRHLRPDPQTKLITTGDIYRLVARSRLPAVQEIEGWIFDEVVTEVHETGIHAEIDFDDVLSQSIKMLLETRMKQVAIEREQQRQSQVVSIHETRLSKIESDKEEAEKQLTLIEMTAEKPKEKTLRRKITDVVRAKNRGIKSIDVIENIGMLDELYKVVCLVCAN